MSSSWGCRKDKRRKLKQSSWKRNKRRPKWLRKKKAAPHSCAFVWYSGLASMLSELFWCSQLELLSCCTETISEHQHQDLKDSMEHQCWDEWSHGTPRLRHGWSHECQGQDMVDLIEHQCQHMNDLTEHQLQTLSLWFYDKVSQKQGPCAIH